MDLKKLINCEAENKDNNVKVVINMFKYLNSDGKEGIEIKYNN